jgi:hypothetical protein
MTRLEEPTNMLAKPEQRSPRWLYARGYDYEVFLAAGQPCSHCSAVLRPSAVRYVDATGIAIVCETCHRDVLRIETFDPTE